MNDKQLLLRAAQQLAKWHEKYGANKAEWLPPAGDVRLLEDIDAFLLPKCSTDPNKTHGFARQASHNAGRYVCECEGRGDE